MTFIFLLKENSKLLLSKTIEKWFLIGVFGLKRVPKGTLFCCVKTHEQCVFTQHLLGSLRGAQRLSTGGYWVPMS